MSIEVKEELGLSKDTHYRIIKLEASSGCSEEDFEKIIYKAERRMKKNPKLHLSLVLDGFNLEHKQSDHVHVLTLVDRMSKMYDMTVIAISPSDNSKIDPI